MVTLEQITESTSVVHGVSISGFGNSLLNKGAQSEFVFIVMSRLVFKMDEFGKEIASVALPAAMALTADPIASLVDTAFIGQIGIAFTY